MDTGRLLVLAEFLETSVPEAEFNMLLWQHRAYVPPMEGTPAGPPSFFGLLPGSPEVPPNPGCGFAGCAIGWAAHSGLFPGLKLREVNPEEKHRDGTKVGLTIVPTYAGGTQWDAINSLFKIYPEDEKFVPETAVSKNGDKFKMSDYLFHQNAYPFNPGPKEVAARIRDVVAASGHRAIPTDLPENVVPIRSETAA